MKYDNEMVNVILTKYPITNGRWLNSEGMGGRSLGEYVMAIYNMSNKVNGSGVIKDMKEGVNFVETVNGIGLKYRIREREYNGVYRYFVRSVEYKNLTEVNGGRDYYVTNGDSGPELITDPWHRRFMKYMGIVNEQLAEVYNVDAYDDMRVMVKDNGNGGIINRLICSVEATSVMGHTIYCVHVYYY